MESTPVASSRANRIARGINLVLGSWLFVSAFLWPHGPVQRANTLTVGLLLVVFALVAMRAPAARWVNTFLCVWLFVSVWMLPHRNPGTMWNDAVVAFLALEVALFPGGGDHPPEASHAPA